MTVRVSVSCPSLPQSVKVLTYLQPQSSDYLQFVENLKLDAQNLFNFTINDSLVKKTTKKTQPTSFMHPLHDETFSVFSL